MAEGRVVTPLEIKRIHDAETARVMKHLEVKDASGWPTRDAAAREEDG